MLKRFVRACLSLMLLSCGGCSWLFVTEAPKGTEHLAYFDCTSNELAPVLDTAGAVIYGIEGAVLATSGELRSDSRVEAVGIPLALAVVTGASALYGFRHTSECDTAKAALMRRIAAQVKSESGGCSNDVQCKGDRICLEHQCVSPPPPLPMPLVPAPPAAEAAPPVPPSSATPESAPAQPGEPTPAPIPAPAPPASPPALPPPPPLPPSAAAPTPAPAAR